MDADEFILTLSELMELEYGVPLHEKLAMSPEQCHLWLRNLYAKRLTLRDTQQTIRTVVQQKGQQDQEDLDDLLYYV
jgi:hypothetical protein